MNLALPARTFIKSAERAIRVDQIVWTDYSEIEQLILRVKTIDGELHTLREIDALEGLMIVCPTAFEGKRLRWARHVWAVHNLFGHPGLQVLAWMKQYKLGFWLHDVTVPKPLGKRDGPTLSENHRNPSPPP